LRFQLPPSNSSAQPPRRQASPWRAALETLAIVAVFAAQAGWPAPDVNEPHYLGKAKHYWNPDWAAGDFFFESADTHRVFYASCGWLSRWLSLEQFAWCGRLVTWTALAWAWRRLCWAALPSGPAGHRWYDAVVASMLFLALNVGCHLAGEWVVGGFEAKGVAYALVFAGLAALVRERWNVALLLLGSASAWHVLVGGWAAVAVGLVWLLDAERPPLKRLWPGMVFGAALALPGLLPALDLNRGLPAEVVAEANDIYVFRRLRHHLVPQAFKWWVIGRYLLMVLAWAIVRRFAPTDRPQAIVQRVVLASLAIALAGLCVSVCTRDEPRWAAALLRFYWFRLADVMLPAGIALALIGIAAARERARGWWIAGAVAASLLLAASSHSGYAVATLFRNAPRADKAGKVADHADWREACLWIAGHTPADAVFITPRTSQSFTWYAGRGEVATLKDLPQDAASVVEWWRRLETIHGTRFPDAQGDWHESLTEPSARRLRWLAARYGADYLITLASPRLQLPRVYENDSYAVYNMR
jgi:hypothetical protein